MTQRKLNDLTKYMRTYSENIPIALLSFLISHSHLLNIDKNNMADVLVSTTYTLFSNVFDQVSCLQGQVQFLFWSEQVPSCYLKHTKAEESASASHVKWGKTNTDTGC